MRTTPQSLFMVKRQRTQDLMLYKRSQLQSSDLMAHALIDIRPKGLHVVLVIQTFNPALVR